jgi:hypothetical protein
MTDPISVGDNLMKPTTHITTPLKWLLVLGMSIAFSLPASAAPKKAPYVYGSLFVSHKAFPLSASSHKDFRNVGRKHNKKRVRLTDGSLRIQAFLWLKGKARTSKVFFELHRVGKKGVKDWKELSLSPNKKLFVFWLIFSGDYLKSGKRYELRAIKVVRRGKKEYKIVLARRRFRVR